RDSDHLKVSKCPTREGPRIGKPPDCTKRRRTCLTKHKRDLTAVFSLVYFNSARRCRCTLGNADSTLGEKSYDLSPGESVSTPSRGFDDSTCRSGASRRAVARDLRAKCRLHATPPRSLLLPAAVFRDATAVLVLARVV